MASVTEYLNELQKITQTNLDILKGINDSFYTKQDNLTINVDNRKYVIPSFISLENKINSLQENFHNLINAPQTGEANFIMNGNSRSIEVKGYNHTPNSIKLNNVNEFGIEQNNIFKDFLTPNPYINFDLFELPNDITSVIVKKIIPKNSELINFFKNILKNNKEEYDTSSQYAYSVLYKQLVNYKVNEDYIEYNTIMKLPVHKNIGSGTYIIKKIISDETDEHLDNYLTLQIRDDIKDERIRTDLNYRLFDETIETPLVPGDCLVTYDDSAKMQIVEVKENSNIIKVKVLNGEYLNLVDSENINELSKINNLSKIKFFSDINFDKDKYIRIPLEEDRYIYVAIAALNDRMNIQSPWGTGLIVDAFKLMNNGQSFKTYYDNNVRNVGDILYEITSILPNSITKYTKKQFEEFSNIKPIINPDNLLVTQINKHLDNSKSIQNIRKLYSQKQDYNSQLNEILMQIETKNNELSTISFDDTTGIRTAYVSQINDLTAKKNELITAITKTIDEISVSANNSDVPIENAKYRIRGFFDYDKFLKDSNLEYLKSHVKGIKVQYRYKNKNQEQGNALSINGKFIFSDWNELSTNFNSVIPIYKDNYNFLPVPNNDNINEPSFNQIDIPISQGETVDIKLKIIYDMGWPYIETSTKWSDIINIEFPIEFTKDVQILDIIEENNNDIETNRFNNIIHKMGINKHIDDKIVDQDIIYFHKPENIASGFYTSERRIIPLKDKLNSIDEEITKLHDEIEGINNENLTVYISKGESSEEILPYYDNVIKVAAYDTFAKGSIGEESTLNNIYVYDHETGLVTANLNLIIKNNSKRSTKIYPMFPGKVGNDVLNKVKNSKFNLNDYCVPYIKQNDQDEYDFNLLKGVWIAYNDQNSVKFTPQISNQLITFRLNNIVDGTLYYKNYGGTDSWILKQNKNKYLCSSKHCMNFENYIKTCKELLKDSPNTENPAKKKENISFLYPFIKKIEDLAPYKNNFYYVLNPNEIISIPIIFEYKIQNNESDDKNDTKNNLLYKIQLNKTMSFDIRTSLYNDPITYTFTVSANNRDSWVDAPLKPILIPNNPLSPTPTLNNLNKYNPVIRL